jgi:hypothetical protein
VCNRRITIGVRTASSFLLVLAVSAGLSLGSPRAGAQEPARAEAASAKLKELQKERLAILREMVKQAAEAFRSGRASYDDVGDASRMVLQAELEQCDTDQERIAVLEKLVAEAKALEERATQIAKTGQGTFRTVLKARADRLQAEITLERVKTRAANPGAKQPPAPLPGDPIATDVRGQIALAEKQVAIKRAAVKVAEAQKKIVAARVASLRAEVAEALASESFSEKQVQRLEELVRQKAVSAEIVDERRAQWDAAKARRLATEGKVVEAEAQVLLEDAHIELAQLEAEEAVLRLRLLTAGAEKKR